jgi:hypothetical protein
VTAWMPIFAGTILAFAALVLAVHLENRRDDRNDHQPPRRVTAIRARAGGTRARRRTTGSMRRRARTTRAWVLSWFWWWDSPAGWHPWQAARECLALRIHGSADDWESEAMHSPALARENTWGRAITRRIQRLHSKEVMPDAGAPECSRRELPGLLPRVSRVPGQDDTHCELGTPGPVAQRESEYPAAWPGTRKATDANRRDAGLGGPLYSWQTGEFAAAIGDTP